MKLALRIAIGLVLLLVLLGVGAVFFIDSLAKRAIERGGTHALGVETRLDSASIGLFSGEFALAGLAIDNPPGFEQPEFLALRSTALELPLSTLMEERITIPSLALEGITIDLERNAAGTNYGVILDNLGRFESGEKEPGGPSEEGGKTFLLQRLVIRDVRAQVNLLPAGGELTKLELSIPEIVVEDIDSEMSLAEMAALVVKTVIQAAIQAGGGVLPADMLADLRGRLDGLEATARVQIDAGLKELEGELRKGAEKLGPEAEKALKEAGDKVEKKLDELFDKKRR